MTYNDPCSLAIAFCNFHVFDQITPGWKLGFNKMWCFPAILGRCFFPNCVDTWKFTNCLKAAQQKRTSYIFQLSAIWIKNDGTFNNLKGFCVHHPKTMTMGEVNPQWHPKRNIVQKTPKAPGTPAAPTVAGGTQQMPIQMLLRWDWQN